jgi:RND family efflux transporter MFP subunit
MRQGILLLTLSLLSVLPAGCKRDQAAPAPPGPPAVKYSFPIEKDVTEYEYFTGYTEAYQRVDIQASGVSGYLEKIGFKDGEFVKKDDVLFVLDQKPYKALLAKAKATLAQTEARRTRVEADYLRAEALFQRGSTGREDLEQKRGDRDEAVANVGAARADVALAEQNLKYTEICAPFDGRMSRRMVDIGKRVTSDTVLSTIVSLKDTYAYFDVDERTLLRQMIKDGTLSTARSGTVVIEIGLADETGYPHKGTVDFVDNRVDLNTGTMWMRGTFAKPNNTEKSDTPFTPGVFIRVRFPIGEIKNAVLVPEQAIGTDQGQKYVYVIEKKKDDEVASYRQVIVGRQHEDGPRVIKSGLKAGEKVVVKGLQRVRPNTPVSPEEEPWMKLTNESMAALRADKVPEAVLARLDSLKDRVFFQAEFSKELTRALKKEDLEQFQPFLLKHAEFKHSKDKTAK